LRQVRGVARCPNGLCVKTKAMSLAWQLHARGSEAEFREEMRRTPASARSPDKPIAERFAAVMPARFMGARVPLPEPKWKQQTGLEGTVATNLDQATGLERAEMLAAMEGRNLFDDAVSAASRRHRHSEISRCMRRGSSRAAQKRSRV
jgi:hypothetical protein